MPKGINKWIVYFSPGYQRWVRRPHWDSSDRVGEYGLFTTVKMMQLQQIAYSMANSNRTIPTIPARRNSTDYHTEMQPRILVDTNEAKGCSVYSVF